MPTIAVVDAQNLLADLIARYRSRVDYLAIRLEEAEGTDILRRGDKIETLSEGLSIGGQIRACYKGGWGLSSFNELATIEARIEEAVSAARIVGDSETQLAQIAPHQDICFVPLTGTNPRHVSLAAKNIAPSTQIIAYSSLEDPKFQKTSNIDCLDAFCKKDTPTPELIKLVRELGEKVLNH